MLAKLNKDIIFFRQISPTLAEGGRCCKDLPAQSATQALKKTHKFTTTTPALQLARAFLSAEKICLLSKRTRLLVALYIFAALAL
jgi:hypothetical protein